MANSRYVTTSLIGANLLVPASATAFALGTRTFGNLGSEWMYVYATNAITQYTTVFIDADYKATGITTTLVQGPGVVGVAPVAFNAGESGWVQLKGSATVRAAAACAANIGLYTTGTAGVLDDATVSSGYIAGIILATAASAGGADDMSAMLSNPVAVRPTSI